MVFIGVDIAQKRDPISVCVAEVEGRAVGGREEVHLMMRHLDRLPLGTPYPKIARRLGEITGRVARRSRARPVTFVDATGIGKPAVDLLRERAHDDRHRPRPHRAARLPVGKRVSAGLVEHNRAHPVLVSQPHLR